jgi:quercetin dioxygenase-like cupin family protein
MYWEWDQGLEFPRHLHAWGEHIVFVSGLWRMEVNGVISVQPPGSALLIPGGMPHCGAVLETSRLLTISIPNLD